MSRAHEHQTDRIGQEPRDERELPGRDSRSSHCTSSTTRGSGPSSDTTDRRLKKTASPIKSRSGAFPVAIPKAVPAASRCGSGSASSRSNIDAPQLMAAPERKRHIRFHTGRSQDPEPGGRVDQVLQSRALTNARISPQYKHTTLPTTGTVSSKSSSERSTPSLVRSAHGATESFKMAVRPSIRRDANPTRLPRATAATARASELGLGLDFSRMTSVAGTGELGEPACEFAGSCRNRSAISVTPFAQRQQHHRTAKIAYRAASEEGTPTHEGSGKGATRFRQSAARIASAGRPRTPSKGEPHRS